MTPRPTCARCEREVDVVSTESATDGSFVVTVVCHGHVDVFEVDLWTRRVGYSLGIEFVRAFTGGIGKPVDAGAVDAVPRTT